MNDTVEQYTEYFAKSRPSYSRFASRYIRDFPGSKPTRELYNNIKAAIKATDISTLEQLLFAADIGDDYNVTKVTVNRWGDNKQIRAELTPKIKPVEPLFRRAGFTIDVPPEPDHNPMRTVLVIPDSQNGFRKVNGKLIPFHSRDAWSIAIAIATDTQPDVVMLMGDMVDLPAFSRYSKSEQIRYQTQHALDETWFFLLALRNAVPQARIVYLFGNHEARYENSLNDLNDEYVGVKRAGTNARVNSLEHILRLDELHIEHHPYKTSVFINDIEFTHGDIVGSGSGSTATKMLAGATQSIVYGHIHKRELVWKTVRRNGYSSSIFALCAGAICDPETTPPIPVRNRNWQMGLAMIEFGTDNIVNPVPIPISRGYSGLVAPYWNKVYNSYEFTELNSK